MDEKTTQLTKAQVTVIREVFHDEINKPNIRCDLGGSLADLVEDALETTLARIGLKKED